MGYSYDSPASGARHIMRLMPLSLPDRQRLIAGSITISPSPDEQSHFTDFFRHPSTSFLLRSPHETLDIRMQARVQVESNSISAYFSPTLSGLPE
jgi:transglutaminase-like putative cysteine protease